MAKTLRTAAREADGASVVTGWIPWAATRRARGYGGQRGRLANVPSTAARRRRREEIGHEGSAVTPGVAQQRQPPGGLDGAQHRIVVVAHLGTEAGLDERRDHERINLAAGGIHAAALVAFPLVEEDEQQAILFPGR